MTSTSAPFRHSGTNEVILQEVQELKMKIQNSGHISILQDPEKKFWQDLVDSNIRAGSLACLWCLKAQVNKRVSAAFNKWKFNTAIAVFEEKQRKEQEENRSEPVQDAINILAKYKDASGNTSNNGKSFSSRLASDSTYNPNYYSSPPSKAFSGEENASSPRNQSLDLLQEETENFAKLSLTLVDKDIDPETKRRMLLTMSKNILQKSSLLPNSSSSTPARSSSSSGSNVLQEDRTVTTTTIIHNPLSHPHQTAHVSIKHSTIEQSNPNGSPAMSERESWNDYRTRSSLDLINQNAASLQQLPKQHRQHLPSAFTFDHIDPSKSSDNNSIHSRQSRRSQGEQTQRSTRSSQPPSQNHQSQDDITRVLQFRRDAHGHYVKGLLSPTPSRPTPPSSQDNPEKQEDRFHQVLAQASKHLSQSNNDHNHRQNSRQQSHSSRANQQQYYYDDDDHQSDHQSQYSVYSDIKSVQSASGRSRSSSPSATPGYLQATRSYLKKTRAGSPPFAAHSMSLPPLPPHHPPHHHSHLPPTAVPQTNRSTSRGSSRSQSRSATPTHLTDTRETAEQHQHPHYRHNDGHSDDKHELRTINNKPLSTSGTATRPSRPPHVSTTLEDPGTASQTHSALPTPQFYDTFHYPHLDNSPSIKAYLEASLRDFEQRKQQQQQQHHHHEQQDSSHHSQDSPSVDESQHQDLAEYAGKDLLELSMLSEEEDKHQGRKEYVAGGEGEQAALVSSFSPLYYVEDVLSDTTSHVSSIHHHNHRHDNAGQNNSSHYDDDSFDHRRHHGRPTGSSSNHSVASSHFSHHSHHSQRSKTSQFSQRSSAAKSFASATSHGAAKKLEKAQWKLLYGDLQDLGRRDWERSLRR